MDETKQRRQSVMTRKKLAAALSRLRRTKSRSATAPPEEYEEKLRRVVLQLHVLAYALCALFRQHLLAGTALATATFDTMRLRLFKVAARVRHSVRRLWFHLATGWPGQPLFELVQARVHAIEPPG